MIWDLPPRWTWWTRLVCLDFDSVRQTCDLGALVGSRTLRGSVGYMHAEEYYTLRLERRSDFALTLGGLRADADVQLFDATGREVAYSIAAGSSDEAISLTLEPGTYVVRVYQYWGDTA